MSGRHRAIAFALLAGAALAAALLVGFAASACPAEAEGQACPGWAANRAIVIGLAALAVGLLVAPFAFIAEFALRRRIVYRGAWQRAARRGMLAGGVVAALAALRLGDALSVPASVFVVVVAVIVEWQVTLRETA